LATEAEINLREKLKDGKMNLKRERETASENERERESEQEREERKEKGKHLQNIITTPPPLQSDPLINYLSNPTSKGIR